MANAESVQEELAAIEDALTVLETGLEALRRALHVVASSAEKTAEAPMMPNYERAEEQLLMAINAAEGAARSLRRRAQLRSARSSGGGG